MSATSLPALFAARVETTAGASGSPDQILPVGCSNTVTQRLAEWSRLGKVLLQNKIETKLFPPWVVTSRLMVMRSLSCWPFTGLTMASAITFDGRSNLRKTEQHAPSPRQSRALNTIILMFMFLNSSKRSTYFTYSHVGFLARGGCGCESNFF
jgi:hypothetical protein